MVDNVSYVQLPLRARGGGLEGCIGLPALQSVPCLSGSCMGGEGHGHLIYIYKVYLIYRELCHMVQYTCPIVLPLISGL